MSLCQCLLCFKLPPVVVDGKNRQKIDPGVHCLWSNNICLYVRKSQSNLHNDISSLSVKALISKCISWNIPVALWAAVRALRLRRGLFVNWKSAGRAGLLESIGISQPHTGFEHIWSVCGGKAWTSAAESTQRMTDFISYLFFFFFFPLLPRNGTRL